MNGKLKQQFMQWYSNSPKAKIFKQIQSAHKIHGHCFLGATIIVDIVSGQIQKCVLMAKTVASVEECIYMTSGHTSWKFHGHELLDHAIHSGMQEIS